MSYINGFEFIKNSLSAEPELRFNGDGIDDFNNWKNLSKEKLKEIMGINLMVSVPLNLKELESENNGKYILRKCIIDTINNLSMPFYVLEPVNKNNKAAIAIHGHGSDGKNGLVGKETIDYKNNIDKFNYTYAYELADKGYTVFVPDLLGSGERIIGIYKDKTAECNDINNALISLGMCLQGVILFENMRLVEYISNLGYDEIVCCGFSGGGHSALWLAVMEDKINKAIVSGFFHSFKDTLIYQNRCGCNFIPNQWKYVDMGDILALAAPKEIYLETGNEDKLNGIRGIEGVLEQIEIADKCYRLFNKEVEVNICNGAHKWYGSQMNKI